MRSLRRYYDCYKIWLKLRIAILFQPGRGFTSVETVWMLPTSFTLNGIYWSFRDRVAYALVSGRTITLKWQSGIKMWHVSYVAARKVSRIYSREVLMLKLYLWNYDNGLRNELEYISRNDPFD